MPSRRESEFARLEQLLQQERRRAEEADERAKQERKKTRPTTFEEYIRACHTLLSKPLRIQTDKSLSTQGSITSPKNKPCPTLLKPWTDFPVLQQQLFERTYEYTPRDTELFSSTQYLTELGQDICDRLLASEKDLEAYQRLAVERPTTHIISHLQRIEEARHAFDLGEGIIFENHANTLIGFLTEALRVIQDLGLHNVLGVRYFDKHDTQFSVEITQGNANIIVPRGALLDSQLIDAFWVFNQDEDDRCHCREQCFPQTGADHQKNHSCG
jgi:hypothetical protein